MARQQGTYKLASNIEPRAAAPLDARTVVPTLADLTASGAFPYPYVGMIVSVQSEGKAYMLTALDTTSSSNWMPVGSGSGSVIEDVTSLPTGSDIKNALYRTKTDSFSCYIHGARFNQDKCIGYFVPYGFTYNIISDTKIEFYVPENTVTKRVSNESEMSFDTMEIVYPNEKGNIQVSLYENGVRVYAQSNADFYSFIIYRDIKLYAGDSTDETVMELAKKSDIQKIFTGTQAEWDALTTSEKLTYKQVNITDDDAGENLDYYSTTEIKTNKVWIDGKPIYRKVYPVTITEPTSSAKIVITLDNSINKDNAKIIAHGGYLEPGTSSDNYIKGIPYIYKDNDTVASITCAISSSGILMIYSNINPGNTGYVWVEYTKTTD